MNIQADEATLRIAAVSDGIFIDNAFHGAASGRSLAVLDPATGHEIARIADGTAADIDAAVAAARRALSGEWGAWSALKRGRVLAEVGRAILTQEEDLARLESADTGKPMAQALGDIRACARYFEYYGAAADKLHGDTIPYRPGHLALTETVPHGVTGHIIPWNLPAQMFGRTIAPALAMGNACVLKPAEDACLTPIRLCMIAAEAGLPMGALNCVPGRGETAGAALSAHPGIDFISFTGSPEVGELVQIAAARNHIGCTWSWAASRRIWSSTTPISTPRFRPSSPGSPPMPGRPARPAAACWCRKASAPRCWRSWPRHSPSWRRGRRAAAASSGR